MPFDKPRDAIIVSALPRGVIAAWLHSGKQINPDDLIM